MLCSRGSSGVSFCCCCCSDYFSSSLALSDSGCCCCSGSPALFGSGCSASAPAPGCPLASVSVSYSATTTSVVSKPTSFGCWSPVSSVSADFSPSVAAHPFLRGTSFRLFFITDGDGRCSFPYSLLPELLLMLLKMQLCTELIVIKPLHQPPEYSKM